MRGKKSRTLVFLFIIFLFIGANYKVFASEKSNNELERFKNWCSENKEEGGEFKLQGDLVINKNLDIIHFKSDITIDVGKYSIIVLDDSYLDIDGDIFCVNIKGSDSSEPIIKASKNSSVFLRNTNIYSDNRTAIYGDNSYIEFGNGFSIKSINNSALKLYNNSEVNFNYNNGSFSSQNAATIYCDETSNISWPYGVGKINIESIGKSPCGIHSENKKVITIMNANINVNGENSIGIYSRSSVDLKSSNIYVSGKNAIGIKLENKLDNIKKDDFSNITPSMNVIEENGKYIIVNEDEPSRTVYTTKDTRFGKLNISDKHDICLKGLENDLLLTIQTKVIWSEDDYNNKIKSGKDFILIGKYKFEDSIADKIQNIKETYPKIKVKVVEENYFKDIGSKFFREMDDEYHIKISYKKPYGAKGICLKYSSDNKNWKSINITSSMNDDYYDVGSYLLRLPNSNKEYYVKLDIIGGVFSGESYTNKVICDNKSSESVENEDLNGGSSGDRGGNGMTEPTRKPNIPLSNTYSENIDNIDGVNSINNKEVNIEKNHTINSVKGDNISSINNTGDVINDDDKKNTQNQIPIKHNADNYTIIVLAIGGFLVYVIGKKIKMKNDNSSH